MNRGLDHSIQHYEEAIKRYEESGKPNLLSFVSGMKRTLKGLQLLKALK